MPVSSLVSTVFSGISHNPPSIVSPWKTTSKHFTLPLYIFNEMEQPTPKPECSERRRAKWYGAMGEMGLNLSVFRNPPLPFLKQILGQHFQQERKYVSKY